jgi:hypothetical protein
MANAISDGLNKPDILGRTGIVTGQFVASAGSVVSVTFSETFTAAPTVSIMVVGGIAAMPTVNATGLSCNVATASASGTFIAIGSQMVN